MPERRIPAMLAFTAMLLTVAPARAAEIRIVPADSIILNPTNPDRGYSDLVVHSVIVATGPEERLALDGVRLDILAQGKIRLSQVIAPDQMVSQARRMAGVPFAEFVSGQLLNAGGLAGVFERPLRFASSETLGPSQALIATRLHFSVGFVPETVRLTARLHDADGHRQTATSQVPVTAYKPAIAYRAPLDGPWLMTSIPGVRSHHRFNPSTEFAVDFFKLGPDGHIIHGDPHKAENFYGFGAPVRAVADGVVVVAIRDQVQDRAALVRKPGEALKAFLGRVDAFHMAMMAKDFRAANAGNLVTIRHEKDGAVEYSSYGHLQSGSVRVAPGDHVRQGETIAKVGDTGDSAAVHLHFQINAGPDAFTAKSLPAVLTNLDASDGNREPGILVTTQAAQNQF